MLGCIKKVAVQPDMVSMIVNNINIIHATLSMNIVNGNSEAYIEMY